jgi:Holliday junction resolvase
MKQKMKESEIQSYFMRKCRENGIYAIKLIATSKRGVADVIVVRNGVYFVEFKSKKGKLSKSQEKFKCLCIANCVKYFVISSKEMCDDFIIFLK